MKDSTQPFSDPNESSAQMEPAGTGESPELGAGSPPVEDALPPPDAPAEESFAQLLAEQGAIRAVRLSVGSKVQAKVVHIAGENVFCSVSPTQEAVLPLADLLDADGKLTVAVGDSVDAFVISMREGISLSRKLGRNAIDVQMLTQARASGIPIDGTVTGVNKGGLEVAVGGARGFCPVSQIDVDFVEDPTSLVGKTLSFLVKEVKDNGRSVVVSRRALLEAERQAKAEEVMATLAVGQRLEGKVSRLTDFGAFVDLGGIDGLIPLGELSFSRIEDVREVLQEGETVTVEVLRIEEDKKRPGKQRIGLSLKATLPDPFVAYADALHEGAAVEGRVVRIEKFGAFIEIFPGVQGLAHISQLSYRRVRHPGDVVQVGETVSARVLGFDPDQRRVSLTLKDAGDDGAERSGARSEDDGSARGAQRRPGDGVDGTVERIERYGVFVALQGGGSALLPAAETGTAPGTDLARAFPIGTALSLQVLSVDDRGRIKVSKRARDAADDRNLVESYNRSHGSSGKGLGTLGDLLMAKKSRR